MSLAQLIFAAADTVPVWGRPVAFILAGCVILLAAFVWDTYHPDGS